MKVLLTTLNSKFIHSNLALKYLYTVVAGGYFDVELKEFTINNDPEYIYSEILRGDYDMVCFSTYIYNVNQTMDICEKLKLADPSLIITLGGPEVSYDYVSFLKGHRYIDIIIRGEGETPFYRLCKAMLTHNRDISKIPGLAYRLDGKIYVNPDQEIGDFSKIPFPYKTLDIEDNKIIYYESSRGCPFRCSYCMSSIEKTVRALDIDRVRSDLGYFLYKKVPQVKFIDRTFNYDAERAYQIFKYLIENDNGITNFHMEICGDLLDDKTIALLSKARKGLFQFEVGIQSINPMTLAAVDRKDNVYPVLYAVSKIIELGNIHVHVDLIAGLPFEDYHSFEKSFNKVYALGADNLQLGFLKLLKGTKIRNEAEKHGYVFSPKAPYQVISNSYISAKELARLKMIEEVLDLYSNKGGFRNTLDYLLKDREPFNFFEELSSFYYENGFQHASHKKEDLYRILYAFDESCKEYLERDMDETLNFDAVKRFKKKGWEI
ncbi:MAG: DUF4080 domain-containing protein [Clostridia bacterium]|nr:DUF4080 domain-containing protein [Clostridia bacterium]